MTSPTYPSLPDPNTWLLGTVTADEFKTNLINLLNQGELWQSYTPTLTATGTNPDPTKWVLNGRYVKVGQSVKFRVSLQYTGGAGAGLGSGAYIISLPTAPAVLNQLYVGHGVATNNYYDYAAITTSDSGTLGFCLFQPGAQPPTRIGAAGPAPSVAWNTNNSVYVNGMYQAAT
jgi:hypothetical protein